MEYPFETVRTVKLCCRCEPHWEGLFDVMCLYEDDETEHDFICELCGRWLAEVRLLNYEPKDNFEVTKKTTLCIDCAERHLPGSNHNLLKKMKKMTGGRCTVCGMVDGKRRVYEVKIFERKTNDKLFESVASTLKEMMEGVDKMEKAQEEYLNKCANALAFWTGFLELYDRHHGMKPCKKVIEITISVLENVVGASAKTEGNHEND